MTYAVTEIVYTLQGDGFSPAQLHDYADKLRTVLLRVPGVAKVEPTIP